MLPGSVWDNTAYGNYLCNVGPWLTENIYEESKLYNVVSTMLGQHCIGILSSQCYPNTSDATLHQKITCAMSAQSVKVCFRRKTVCSFKYVWW